MARIIPIPALRPALSGTEDRIGPYSVRSCAVAGRPGKSAYELAVENGFSGTEAEWLASLVGAAGPAGAAGAAGPAGPAGAAGPAGETGPAGADGKSAYELAVENGFSGTEAEWLASLVGAAGPAGAAGVTGPAGPAGAAGPTGPAGPGVPAGGTTGQFLIKHSDADYDAAWFTVPPANGGRF